MEVFGLFLLGGWKREEITIDIVPLFETVADLKHAADIMQKLYENQIYREHLARRQNTQTIMLGFSDGTKDGGYLMANWSIYKAKDELTEISKNTASASSFLTVAAVRRLAAAEKLINFILRWAKIFPTKRLN